MDEKNMSLGSNEENPLKENASITGNEDQNLLSEEDGEDIIELTDVVKPAPSEDNDVIDLVDSVGGEIGSTMDLEEELIVEKLDEEARLDDLLNETIELDEVIEEEGGKESDGEGPFMQDLGLELDDSPDEADLTPAGISNFENENEIQDISVSEEQLKTALERVVKDIYSEKIESMLEELVEKTVRQEIEKLKNLIEDSAKDA